MLIINALNADAFKLLYLWIFQANGQSSTLAELMELAHMTPHKIVKAMNELKKHGLANVFGHLRHSPAELTPNAFNLFPLPAFEREVPGSIPLDALVEGGVEKQVFGNPQDLANQHDLLQKKFFSDAESLRVVVVDDSDSDQEDPQQQLGNDEKIFLDEPPGGDDWPVREILEAAGIERRRHPGPGMHRRFIAWLVYGYQYKKSDPDGHGIVSPAHFALSRIGLQPGQGYLEIAAAGPGEVLKEMEPYRFSPRWYDILKPARENGFRALLETFFAEVEEDDE